MEKFSRTLRGYNPEEVNEFLDNVIKQVEQIVAESKNKDIKIAELEKSLEQSKHKLETYERMEATLNKAIIMAQKTSEQIKLNAHDESELIINDAKQNANRIVNEALIRAENTEREAMLLQRNINVFKRRVRDIVEAQLEVVKELDTVEL